MDLSSNTELTGLGETASVVVGAASDLGCPIYLTGALARDLWLVFGFGIEPERLTKDVDFAVQCADWSVFETLSQALERRGFQRVGAIRHKFRDSGTEIDLIPYGGVERADRTIAWPPDGNRVMNLLGFSELVGETTTMTLPGEIRIDVIDQHALALVKLLAWEDRRKDGVHKDAADLHTLGKTYLKTRVARLELEAEAAILETNSFDSSRAGSYLLGSDMSGVGSQELASAVGRILERESTEEGLLLLAGAIQREARLYEEGAALRFLQAMSNGYISS